MMLILIVLIALVSVGSVKTTLTGLGLMGKDVVAEQGCHAPVILYTSIMNITAI